MPEVPTRMPTVRKIRPDALPSPRQVAEQSAGYALIQWQNLPAKSRDRNELTILRKQIEEDRAKQAEMTALIGQPAPDDLDADWLLQHGEKLLEKEEEFSEAVRPVVGLLKDLLLPSRVLEPEVELLVRDSVEILEAWAPLYRDLGNRMLEFATERRAAVGDVLRARPVKGEIDHSALSREFIARFPKIRAAVAK
jgi:hypothetical protein